MPTKKAPWDKVNPKKRKSASQHLTPTQKAAAKRRAQRAGRPYPNLVDNMAVAKKTGGKNKATNKRAKKKAARKRSSAAKK